MTNLTADQWQLLEKVETALEYRRRIDDELLKLIYRLWLSGASWGQLARVLGISAEGARVTWGKRCLAMHAGTKSAAPG